MKLLFLAVFFSCIFVGCGADKQPLGKSKEKQLDHASFPRDKEILLDLGNGVSMKLALIPAGKFQMASGSGKSDRDTGQTVEIATSFYIGVTEVTQKQYQAVMGLNPSAIKGNQRPVEHVSWHDAVIFCKKLSQKIDKSVRLPSEAEWEYACRAGSTVKYCFGDNEKELYKYACYAEETDRNCTVGKFKSNKWNLFDMHGNAGEWTGNWYGKDAVSEHYAKGNLAGPDKGKQRVVRGGSWDEHGKNLRSSFRNVKPPVSGRGIYGSIGFRCAYDSAE